VPSSTPAAAISPDTDTGSFFAVSAEAQLPEGLAKLFARACERLGFVPNVFRVYAYRPGRLSAWFSHYRQCTSRPTTSAPLIAS
jgi:hypothetical protein